MKICRLLSVLFALAAIAGVSAAEQDLSLAGRWRFALDRADAGITERWFDHRLSDEIKLPGSLPERGIGDDVTVDTKWTGGIVDQSFYTAPQFAKYRQPGHVKVPFWLQPDKYYVGVAWFQRDIEVSADWQDRRLALFLERPHWETRVWVDGKFMGTNNSLAVAHEYDLGSLAPGKHTVAIRVDNRMVIDLNANSHCIGDHTQGNWNGIVGRIEVRATPRVWIEEAQVYPQVASKSATVRARIGNTTGRPGRGVLQVGTKRKEVSWGAEGGTAEIQIELGAAARLWDEFSPNLQDLTLTLLPEQGDSATCHARFGLRELSTVGTQFLINGRKTLLRGTLECCIFPKTGYPPTAPGEWKRIIRVAKAHGLNLFRFHSYCPPEAAFAAADELGMYFQIETCGAEVGDDKPVDQWIYDETDRILRTYGNHPSFLLMTYGNEPTGKKAGAFFAKYVEHCKTLDPRRLYSSASGWPEIPENQFHVSYGNPPIRIQAWGGGLGSRINALPPETTTDYRDFIARRSVPVITHEMGQWCVYPNFKEIPKYTGYLKAKNFDIFRDFLDGHGMAGLARPFLLASGKLQVLCYKEDIEAALRTKGMGGFELLDLHDFPGQGTALIGVLDPFWDAKGYVPAKEYSRFCNSTVPLARLGKRVFTSDEKLEARIEIAHFGPHPMKAAATWKLVAADGSVCASGTFPPIDLAVDNGIDLGNVSADLTNVKAPAQCKLVAQVQEMGRTGLPAGKFENDWDIWIYPSPAASAPQAGSEALVTSQFDDSAMARLACGGKVLLTIPGRRVRNFETEPVELGFSSIFWNTAWTIRQAPTTLGILCDPKHPALAEFPTDFHSNWQWWYLIHRAGALRLDLLPRDLKPIVRIIDDWATARPLGLAVEGKVGKGKIVICGFDLTRDADDPVSRQMRMSLLDYMASNKFKPATEFTAAQVKSLIRVDP